FIGYTRNLAIPHHPIGLAMPLLM
ncbi:hypothetical protein EUTSA_v100111330mg, partial [Eutrema salsugineum]